MSLYTIGFYYSKKGFRTNFMELIIENTELRVADYVFLGKESCAHEHEIFMPMVLRYIGSRVGLSDCPDLGVICMTEGDRFRFDDFDSALSAGRRLYDDAVRYVNFK